MNSLDISEPSAGVMLLTLNRPAARNALDLDLTQGLLAALADFRLAPHWRSAVITGTGPAFCAGLDLKGFSTPDSPRHLVGEAIMSLPNLGKPIVAAVNGAAYTGGLEIVLSCDFAIASSLARFADTHAKIGALSGSGMGSRLPRAVGAAWARQMMLTCEPVDAATALRIGLVNEVTEPENLIPRAVALASAIAAYDPELVQLAKRVIDTGHGSTLEAAIRIERETLAERKAKGSMSWQR